MIVRWSTSLIIILLYLSTTQHVFARKKIVKLIVPHNIKYVHHTHVLLVKPVTKKSTKLLEEVVEEAPNYKHVHYHDYPKQIKKPQIRYLLPYIESKENAHRSFKIVSPVKAAAKKEKYLVPVNEFHKKRTQSEEVKAKSVGQPLHPSLKLPYAESIPSYDYHPSSPYHFEEPSSHDDESYLSEYHTIPDGYESEYQQYKNLVDSGSDSYENGEWDNEKYSYPDETQLLSTYKPKPNYKYLK